MAGKHSPKRAPKSSREREPESASQPVAPGGSGTPTGDVNKRWAKLFAATWSDADLKRRLITDPHAVLKEYNIEVPDSTRITVHEIQPGELHIALPPVPETLRSLEEEVFVHKIAAAGCCCWPG